MCDPLTHRGWDDVMMVTEGHGWLKGSCEGSRGDGSEEFPVGVVIAEGHGIESSLAAQRVKDLAYHCCGSGGCCGAGSVPAQELLNATGTANEEKRQQHVVKLQKTTRTHKMSACKTGETAAP